jgi:hypothetical protein
MKTGTHDGEEVEKLYKDIDKMLKYDKGDENLIILSDWNDRIGQRKDGMIAGSYGLGESLVEFCAKHKFVIANLLLSLAPQPSLGLGIRQNFRLNFLEAPEHFLFYRLGLLALRANPIAEDQASVFISTRGRVATHFSRLLRRLYKECNIIFAKESWNK